MSDYPEAEVIVYAQPVDSESDAESDFFRKPMLIADAEEVLPLYKRMWVWSAVVFFAGSIGLAVFLALKFTKSSSKEASTSSVEPFPMPSPIPTMPPTISDSPSSSPTSSPIDYQMNVLNALYEATNGTDWSNDTLWWSNYGICAWYGLTCNNNGDVIGIDLASNNLQGM